MVCLSKNCVRPISKSTSVLSCLHAWREIPNQHVDWDPPHIICQWFCILFLSNVRKTTHATDGAELQDEAGRQQPCKPKRGTWWNKPPVLLQLHCHCDLQQPSREKENLKTGTSAFHFGFERVIFLPRLTESYAGWTPLPCAAFLSIQAACPPHAAPSSSLKTGYNYSDYLRDTTPLTEAVFSKSDSKPSKDYIHFIWLSLS